MLVRRCAIVMIEPRERLDFDLTVLFRGEGAFATHIEWLALAAHLDQPVVLSIADLELLGRFGETLWIDRSSLPTDLSQTGIDTLLTAGLLIADSIHPEHRHRDERVRATHWRALSALTHIHSRWHDINAIRDSTAGYTDIRDMVAQLGPPPPETIDRRPTDARITLPAAPSDRLDPILHARYTGRNYDSRAVLPLATASRLLQRSFGAQWTRELAPGAVALKKTSPSGGSLHPTEAYLLVQRVEGIAPGLYHYHPIDHALEPLATLTDTAARTTALRFVADQHWFADAPLMVVLATRAQRNFWKYRNHPKAYRAVLLDAGHLSQTFYLLAAEAGLPAFITAAINEVEIEQAFGLDPIDDLVVAVLGCGPAAEHPETVEFRHIPHLPDPH